MFLDTYWLVTVCKHDLLLRIFAFQTGMYSLAAMALLKTDINSGVLMSLNRIKKDGLKVSSLDQGCHHRVAHKTGKLMFPKLGER
jgi:hypothetical protein